MFRRLWAPLIGAAVLLAPATATADQAVQVGGALALLNKPGAPRASVILIPGGDGVLGVQPDGSFSSLRGNQLVRTRKAYLANGVATLTIDSGVSVGAAVAYMRSIARPVVVATSRGSLRVAGRLAPSPTAWCSVLRSSARCSRRWARPARCRQRWSCIAGWTGAASPRPRVSSRSRPGAEAG